MLGKTRAKAYEMRAVKKEKEMTGNETTEMREEIIETGVCIHNSF